MILDNAQTVWLMKKDMEYFYYDIVDITYMADAIAVFCHTTDDFVRHDFIRVTKYDDSTLIDVHTCDRELLAEAISFAKETGFSPVYLSVDHDMDSSDINRRHPIESTPVKAHKHWGIYGAIKNTGEAEDNIMVSVPSRTDRDLIASLSDKEWAFLPQRIKFITNILIAQKDDRLLGYLVYDSVEAGHYDIVMVYTHPDCRHMGVATALVKEFALSCEREKGTAYYVCANSEGSAELARSLNIREVRKPNTVYKLI